jgi:hypothetical protein
MAEIIQKQDNRIDINDKMVDYAKFNVNIDDRDTSISNVNNTGDFEKVSRTNEVKKKISDLKNVKKIYFYFSKFDDNQSSIVADAITKNEKISKKISHKSLDVDIMEGNYPDPDLINGTPTILVITIDNDNVPIRGVSKCLEWLNEKSQTVAHQTNNTSNIVSNNVGSAGRHEAHNDYTGGANINKENAESFIKDSRFSESEGNNKKDFQHEMDELTKQRILDVPLPNTLIM